jgi:thioredoxin reductase
MSTAITATSADPRELYDVIIIGGSYAGLSAALTLYRATHTCLIVDTGSPRNQAAMNMRLTPGWEGQNPRKMRDAARAELHESGLVKFVSEAVRRVEKTSEGQFEVIDAGAGTWKARKILLAVGVEEIYPDIEGYADNYGRSM